MSDEIALALVRYLETQDNPDEKMMADRDGSFSAKELIHEISEETDVGKRVEQGIILLTISLLFRKVEKLPPTSKIFINNKNKAEYELLNIAMSKGEEDEGRSIAVYVGEGKKVYTRPFDEFMQKFTHKDNTYMKRYVTFGQDHIHYIGGQVFDKDCVAEMYGDREDVFRLFTDKFCFEYPEKQFDKSRKNMKHFPKGIIRVKAT